MTEAKNNFSVGDYIIDFEHIYQITDKKDQTDSSGKSHSYFFYQPVDSGRQSSAVYSTPIDNITKSGFRLLMNRDQIDKLLEAAATPFDQTTTLDYKIVKETLYQNDSLKSLQILKQLFLEKEKSPETFSRTSKEILEPIMKHLSEEIAFVTKEPVVKVTAKLSSLLLKSIKL